jgi:hypothetical protein
MAIGYMYGTSSILRTMKKKSGMDIEDLFDGPRAAIKCGSCKQHVSTEKRLHVIDVARASAARYGIVVSSCGCDDADILPDSKCGICWRSGK